MSIHETIEFDNSGKPIRNPIFRRVFLALVVLLVGLLGYGLGRLDRGAMRPPIEIRYDTGAFESSPGQGSASAVSAGLSKDSVYASSKGTKYYYQGCKSTISEANKINFATAALAETAGYTLAAGCRRP